MAMNSEINRCILTSTYLHTYDKCKCNNTVMLAGIKNFVFFSKFLFASNVKLKFAQELEGKH